jgi:hypothetical protein
VINERIEHNNLILLDQVDNLIEIERELDLYGAGRPHLLVVVVLVEETLDEQLLALRVQVELVDVYIEAECDDGPVGDYEQNEEGSY